MTSNARAVMEWEASARERALAGTLDNLRRFTADEAERFWSWTIPGPDGHIYWNGPERFTRNDGRQRLPQRWLYERRHQCQLAHTVRVLPSCGDPSCIGHLQLETRRPERALLFSDERILGALQVFGLRHDGRGPSKREWDRSGLRPTGEIIARRFGGWRNAIVAAGLTPVPSRARRSRDDVIDGLMALAADLGRVPTSSDYNRHALKLTARGYPSEKTLYRHFGTWREALEAAGLG